MIYLVIIGIIVLVISVYFISYTANEKTPIPEELQERYEEAQTCSGCHAKRQHLIPEEVIIEFKEENSLWQFYGQH